MLLGAKPVYIFFSSLDSKGNMGEELLIISLRAAESLKSIMRPNRCFSQMRQACSAAMMILNSGRSGEHELDENFNMSLIV